jgi:hypothetical protein
MPQVLHLLRSCFAPSLPIYGIRVAAEGVTANEAVEKLNGKFCDCNPGYFLAKSQHLS